MRGNGAGGSEFAETTAIFDLMSRVLFGMATSLHSPNSARVLREYDSLLGAPPRGEMPKVKGMSANYSAERRRCLIRRAAAFAPGAPVTPPPGCVPAPERKSPSIGVSWRPIP